MQFVLILMNGIALAGISLLVTSLTLDAIQGPSATYLSVIPIDREVRQGGLFRAMVHYRKHRDCGGAAIITLTHAATGTHRIISSLPIGDRPPGEFTVERKYTVPADALIGPSFFAETLAYQCQSDPSIVRSPPMEVIIK